MLVRSVCVCVCVCVYRCPLICIILVDFCSDTVGYVLSLFRNK